ncbi:MAG: hypothetical protein Q7W13_04670 [Bacteroidia bacterium]|nr:hypothetical protein [Bacteroidia bacterium]
MKKLTKPLTSVAPVNVNSTNLQAYDSPLGPIKNVHSSIYMISFAASTN